MTEEDLILKFVMEGNARHQRLQLITYETVRDKVNLGTRLSINVATEEELWDTIQEVRVPLRTSLDDKEQ